MSSEGAATVGAALLCAFVLPEYPYNARLLKPLEREVAVWRLEIEAGAAEGNEKVGAWAGFKEGFHDPKVCHLLNELWDYGLTWLPSFMRSSSST